MHTNRSNPKVPNPPFPLQSSQQESSTLELFFLRLTHGLLMSSAHHKLLIPH